MSRLSIVCSGGRKCCKLDDLSAVVVLFHVGCINKCTGNHSEQSGKEVPFATATVQTAHAASSLPLPLVAFLAIYCVPSSFVSGWQDKNRQKDLAKQDVKNVKHEGERLHTSKSMTTSLIFTILLLVL